MATVITSDSWIGLLVLAVDNNYIPHAVRIAKILVKEGRNDSRLSWFANLRQDLVIRMNGEELLSNFFEEFPDDKHWQTQ